MKWRREVDPTDAAGFAAAREVCWRRVPHFRQACMFLPAQRRDAACAVAAFSLMIHDALVPPKVEAAEDGGGCSGADETLSLLRDRLDEIYTHRLELPLPQFRSSDQHVLHAATRTIHTCELPQAWWMEFAEGLCADRTITRYATWSSLHRYLRATGGSVGRMICAVLGPRHTDAFAHAEQLGAALRYTAILQHLPHHLDAGRVYLPLEDLARVRYSERELLERAGGERFERLIRVQTQRLGEMYQRSVEVTAWLSSDAAKLAASALWLLGVELVRQIERSGQRLLERPVEITPAHKLRLLGRLWSIAHRQPGAPPPRI